MRYFLIAAIILVSCATPNVLTPKTGPGTPYPCGVEGVDCGNGMCCPQYHRCGNLNVFNPDEMCHFIGSDI